MPHGLEYVIRPYQSPASHGTVVIASTPTATRERATLTWGAKATMPEVEVEGGVSVACCNEGLTEFRREAETVRISQPGKPENYVDVSRSRNLTLKKAERNSCSHDQSQTSRVAQALDEGYKILSNRMNFNAPHSKQCQVTWALDNNTTAT